MANDKDPPATTPPMKKTVTVVDFDALKDGVPQRLSLKDEGDGMITLEISGERWTCVKQDLMDTIGLLTS